MSIWEKWLKERGTDPAVYCPVEGGNVIVGMMLIGQPDEPVVGEFWEDEEGLMHVKFYEDCA